MARVTIRRARSRLRSGIRVMCAGAICLSSVGVHAFGHDDRFTVSGFGTLGLVYNSSDEFDFVRDLTQRGGARDGFSAEVDSILGLQLNYRFSPEVEAIVQVVSRNDQDGHLPADLTWALLKYEPSPSWSFRVGRMGTDTFMLSDSRDVGYSYTWIRPPFEYFGLQQLNHHDGLDVTYTTPWRNGVFWATAYGGFADEALVTGDDSEYDLGGTSILGGNLNYQVGDWWLRLGYGRFELDKELAGLQPLLDFLRGFNPVSAALGDDLGLADSAGDHLVAGVVYQNGPWQIQAMADRSTTESRLFHDFYSGYLTLSYRFQQWTPYVSFARVESHESARATGLPPGSPPDQLIQDVLASGHTHQHTTAIGMRYDFRQNMALKMQVDRLKAADAGSSLTWEPDPGWDGSGTIFSASLDFAF